METRVSENVRTILSLTGEELKEFLDNEDPLEIVDFFSDEDFRSVLEHLYSNGVKLSEYRGYFTIASGVEILIRFLHSKGKDQEKIVEFILGGSINESNHTAEGAVSNYVKSILA